MTTMLCGRSDQSGVSAGRRLAGRGTCAKAGATWEDSDLGATFLYVAHDQVEAMSMGDKIGMLNKGRLVQVGTPSQVYGAPCNTFVARAVGSPPMNLIDGRVVAGQVALGDGGLPVVAPEGRDLAFGVRPETIRLESGVPVTARVFAIEDHEMVRILTMMGGDVRLHATVPARTKVALDEVVRFGWVPGKVVGFDRATGINLSLV